MLKYLITHADVVRARIPCVLQVHDGRGCIGTTVTAKSQWQSRSEQNRWPERHNHDP